ncbi:MAG TPA: TIGR04551 family protein [Kofleriaceae bacterium]|nr:TIGR04551 family protein [Kofleriaceae bacterium]
MIRRVLTPCALALILTAGTAYAQMGPSPMGGAPGGAGGEEPKHEGVAEAAPKTPGLLPTTPTLPPPKSHRKRLQVLELGGYLRLRTNWFRSFDLGFKDNPALGGAPFARALGCSGDPSISLSPCSPSLSDANMRLRLEPVVNIDETTSVHAQIDVLDNQILGSTPTGSYLDGSPTPADVPFGAFSNSVTAPIAGINDSRNSIVVKRAWGEVGTPLGLVQFGRMPDHWGLGILHNGGGEDTVNGGYDLDSDYGDSVDRVAFSAQIPGTRLKAMVAADWPNSRLTSTMTGNPVGRTAGQAYDLDDNDDVAQYSVAVSSTDTPTEFKDAIDRGESALNWGAYIQQRTQEWDYAPAQSLGGTPDPNGLVPRDYKAYVIDPWIKFGTGNWLFEAEAVGVVGSMNITDLDLKSAECQQYVPSKMATRTCQTGNIDIRQMGGVARATYAADGGKLKFSFETGYASGDQYDAEDVVGGRLQPAPGETNISHIRSLPLAGDSNMTQMIFDRDYRVDLILFRHLIGAVTNAIYVRPKLEWNMSNSFVLRVWNVTSFAARPVATPGNGAMYGLEFDGDLGYQSSAFFAGVSYGALFPLGALAHPDTSSQVGGGPGFPYDATNLGDGETAHTIQMRLVLKF